MLGQVVDFLLFHYERWFVSGVQRRRQRDHRRRRAADPRQLPAAPRRSRCRRTAGSHDGRHARQPARLLRRRRPRDRDRRAGARAIRRADLRAPRGRPQQVRGRRSARKGRGVRRGAGRGSGRQHRRVLRARRVEGGARRSRRARPARIRRHLSAGHQGPRRGRQDARAGTRDRHDRPRGPPRGRGNDGPVRRRHPPRRIGRRRARASNVRDPAQARLRHADHAVGRRCRRDRRGAEGALSRESSARRRTTSATRRRTARTPSSSWRRRSTW